MITMLGDAEKLPFSDNFFRLTMGSPPYMDARTYSVTGIARKLREWVDWMELCTIEALRVTHGPVLWVVAGRGGSRYQPGPEMLIASLFEHHDVHVLHPNIWTKNAPPTGKGWFSNDWEYVLAFAKKLPLPIWNPEAIGTELKYKAGGHFRQRKKDGSRPRGSDYPTHQFRKRPSNVFNVPVGGGLMGWDGCHENEAPYPEKLCERFIKVLTNPGDRVLDPFAGSFTTPAVADLLGRDGYGIDIRKSQIELGKRRAKYVAKILAERKP